jgi:NAD(P)-dependent dehydrogenase (short-subunit alcohol dehydrogenase family)
MEELSGKTALVTGSTDGVGRLVARKLGQAGARVLVHGRDAERGERVIAEIKASGGAASFLAADLSSLEAGAAQVIATEEVDFMQEVIRLTDGNGARVAFRRIGCETSDAGSAALATSSGASAGMLGRRDGRVTRDETLAQARVICGASDLSVSRDGEGAASENR